jgi:carbonic anhydrase
MSLDPHRRPTNSVFPAAPIVQASIVRMLRHSRVDFGTRALLREWRAMLSLRDVRADALAGAMVASAALPLSLAIALASDVHPAIGLTTAIIAGIVTALFGGQSISVTGPAAALAVLVGQIVDVHGLSGLLFVGLGCGILQLATGVLGLSRFVRLIPVSVVHGFTAGVGVLLLVGQLPRALGLPAPDESHVFDVIAHLATLVAHANPIALAMSVSVVMVMLVLGRAWPKIPVALAAIAIPAFFAVSMELDVPLLGEIPSMWRLPSWPAWPRHGLAALVGDMVVVYALASLESLLAASAIDKLRASTTQHDPDQEMIGQGLGNFMVALFGGIPVASVMVRSSLNVHAGARTRRSAIVQALMLALIAYFGASFLSHIPVAALAGVLLAMGLRMLEPRYFIELWHASRTEAYVFLITIFSVVAFDLFVGIQAGIVAAFAVALVRVTRARGEIHPAHDGSPHHVTFVGPLTFLSSAKLDGIRAELSGLDAGHGLVIDVRHVPTVDASAAGLLLEMVQAWRTRAGSAALLGPTADVEKRLLALGPPGTEKLIAHFESELDTVLDRDPTRAAASAHRRLLAGVGQFQNEVRKQLSPLLDRLAAGQAPHTMFLTCADSRVPPMLMTGSHPGELFVVRNIGALMPPIGHDSLNDEGAALEYAIEVLGVRNVVICGHSKCGAMTALYEGKSLDGLPSLARWAKGAGALAGDLSKFESVNEATKACAVRQLESLLSYSVVKDAVALGAVRLTAWFYDVETSEVWEWVPERESYFPVGTRQDAAT